MKTTSFEISKKLAEIGFKREINFAFKEIDPSRHRFSIGRMDHCEGWFPSYDLETILDALPKFIVSDQKLFSPSFVAYGQHEDEFISCDKEQGESLADTAARLLIVLQEKKLIKF